MNDMSTGITNSQTFMDKVYEKIAGFDKNETEKGFHPIMKVMDKIGKWRDEDSTIARKVVFGAALVGLSLGFLIDSVWIV